MIDLSFMVVFFIVLILYQVASSQLSPAGASVLLVHDPMTGHRYDERALASDAPAMTCGRTGDEVDGVR